MIIDHLGRNEGLDSMRLPQESAGWHLAAIPDQTWRSQRPVYLLEFGIVPAPVPCRRNIGTFTLQGSRSIPLRCSHHHNRSPSQIGHFTPAKVASTNQCPYFAHYKNWTHVKSPPVHMPQIFSSHSMSGCIHQLSVEEISKPPKGTKDARHQFLGLKRVQGSIYLAPPGFLPKLLIQCAKA